MFKDKHYIFLFLSNRKNLGIGDGFIFNNKGIVAHLQTKTFLNLLFTHAYKSKEPRIYRNLSLREEFTGQILVNNLKPSVNNNPCFSLLKMS